MILSFKKKFPWGEETNFEEKIFTGIKIHTIREDPHCRWKPGMKIQMAHGVRTRNYTCFMESECVSVQSIKINYYWKGDMPQGMEIIIDGNLFYSQSGHGSYGSGNLDLLAKNDGFDSALDFLKWFDDDLEGRIIHWTPFKY